MPSIEKVNADIEVVKKSLKDNQDRFQILLKRQTFLGLYKSALERDLRKRQKDYAEILMWRQAERKRQKERGFPMPEPLLSDVNFSSSCTWDPWLCMYIPKETDKDLDMYVPSQLTLDYDTGHHYVTSQQMLKEFLKE